MLEVKNAKAYNLKESIITRRNAMCIDMPDAKELIIGK